VKSGTLAIASRPHQSAQSGRLQRTVQGRRCRRWSSHAPVRWEKIQHYVSMSWSIKNLCANIHDHPSLPSSAMAMMIVTMVVRLRLQ
jgi:hypothetical protein